MEPAVRCARATRGKPIVIHASWKHLIIEALNQSVQLETVIQA
jgi:hypothetical protein